MKEALISIMRQEYFQIEAQIAAELEREAPDVDRLQDLRIEAQSLRRQLDRYTEH